MGSALAEAEGSRRLITLDTSGILALLDREYRDHRCVADAFAADPGPYVVPAATLGEVGYLLARDLGPRVERAFLHDLTFGLFQLDCGEDDLERVGALVARYESLTLGLVDAAVIACAVRRGGRVLTLDRRHFDVVARELPLEIVP